MAFLKKKSSDEPPAEMNTRLAKGSHIEGQLTTSRAVVLAGEFLGSIKAGKELCIESGATFEGDANSGVFSLYGKAEGNFYCSAARFYPGSHWKGKLNTKKLHIVKGAELVGEIKENHNR